MKERKTKDREISTLLLSGNSLEETAEKAGKSIRTIRRHLKKNVERLTFLSELEGTNPSILYSKKLLDIIEHLDNITELILNMEENILTDKQYREAGLSDKSRKEKKILVFRHYCGDDIKCNCCGERNIELLTLDHINDDGDRHRKEIKTNSIYDYLIRNNFKTTYKFQVACYNCNLGRYRNGGICPHKEP